MNKTELNDLLSRVKKLHFIGIGGISMSSLAMIAKDRGFEVTGSDRSRSEATEKLEASGIKLIYAHDAQNVEGCEAIVYTAAVHDDNPEMARAIELGLPRIKRAEFLGYIMQAYKNRIGVAGMHGKSTTTSMISEVFMTAGVDPTIVNGVRLPMLDGGAYRVGGKEHFIFEACEYTDSFLSFFPSIAVVPFALIYHQGLYILVAIPAKDTRIRFYRIDRMENVVISHADRLHEEVFNEIDIDRFTSGTFGLRASEVRDVTLRCHKSLVDTIMDRFGADVPFTIVDEKYFEITVPAVMNSDFYGWLVSLGGRISIIAPKKARISFEMACRKNYRPYLFGANRKVFELFVD